MTTPLDIEAATSERALAQRELPRFVWVKFVGETPLAVDQVMAIKSLTVSIEHGTVALHPISHGVHGACAYASGPGMRAYPRTDTVTITVDLSTLRVPKKGKGLLEWLKAPWGSK